MRVYTSRIHWVDRGTGTPKDKDLVTINFVSDVHTTILYETLQVVGLAEAARTAIRLRKKTMNLCACDSEERERGVGADESFFILKKDEKNRKKESKK